MRRGRGSKNLFQWLLERPQQDLLDLPAFARPSQQISSGRENAPSDDAAAFMTALNLEMADWWETAAENYLSHVSKVNLCLGVTAQTLGISGREPCHFLSD